MESITDKPVLDIKLPMKCSTYKSITKRIKDFGWLIVFLILAIGLSCIGAFVALGIVCGILLLLSGMGFIILPHLDNITLGIIATCGVVGMWLLICKELNIIKISCVKDDQ